MVCSVSGCLMDVRDDNRWGRLEETTLSTFEARNGIKLPARRAIEHALLLDWVFDWNRGGQGKIAVAGS